MSLLGKLIGGASDPKRILGVLFEHLRVEPGVEEQLRRAAQRGPIVFVVRAVSAVDALAIAHLSQRWGLPSLGFAHDLAALPAALLGCGRERTASELLAALDRGRSAILFLKRPPSVFTTTGRGRSEGDELLAGLIAHAREHAGELTLVPITFLWSLSPGHQRLSPIDVVLGPTDMPGDLRATMQLLGSLQHGAVRLGELVDLREFVRGQTDEAGDYALVRRLTYSLLRKLERERRAALGPAEKSPARLRDEVLRSAKLARLIKDLAQGDAHKQREIEEKARKLLDELRAEPNPTMLRASEPVLDRLVRRVFSDVDVSGVEQVREAVRRGTVVFLPCHKSHVDYLVLSYVLRKNLLELPVVAAGDNLAFFPVGEILRRGGAFFIRRDFRGDRLYATVVDAYVRRLLKDGWALEFYLEGGRSRTGKLLAPKLGLLNLVVDAALSLEGRPVSFVPVHIGYERLMEDFELAEEQAGAPKQRESYRSLFAVADALGYDYGRVSVSFGQPIELGSLRREVLGEGPSQPLSPAKRRAITNRLATQVVGGIHAGARITAGGLVAMSLLDMEGRGLLHPELVARCERLWSIATRAGARPASQLLHGDGRLREAAIRDAAIILVRGGMIREHAPDATLARSGKRKAPKSRDDVVYTVPEDGRARLDLSKNGILHFFADRSLISLAFRGARARVVPRVRLVEDAVALGRMLAHDLLSLGDGPLEVRVELTIEDMVQLGELATTASGLAVGPGNQDADGMTWLRAHASHLVPMLEGYRVLSRTLRLLEGGPLPQRDLVKRALSVGRQMFLGGEIDRREAISAPLFASAIEAFLERGALTRNQEILALPADVGEAELRALEMLLHRHASSETSAATLSVPAPPADRSSGP